MMKYPRGGYVDPSALIHNYLLTTIQRSYKDHHHGEEPCGEPSNAAVCSVDFVQVPRVLWRAFASLWSRDGFAFDFVRRAACYPLEWAAAATEYGAVALCVVQQRHPDGASSATSSVPMVPSADSSSSYAAHIGDAARAIKCAAEAASRGSTSLCAQEAWCALSHLLSIARFEVFAPLPLIHMVGALRTSLYNTLVSCATAIGLSHPNTPPTQQDASSWHFYMQLALRCVVEPVEAVPITVATLYGLGAVEQLTSTHILRHVTYRTALLWLACGTAHVAYVSTKTAVYRYLARKLAKAKRASLSKRHNALWAWRVVPAHVACCLAAGILCHPLLYLARGSDVLIAMNMVSDVSKSDVMTLLKKCCCGVLQLPPISAPTVVSLQHAAMASVAALLRLCRWWLLRSALDAVATTVEMAVYSL